MRNSLSCNGDIMLFSILLSSAFLMQASVVAEKAAKSLADMQLAEDSESSKEEEAEESPIEKEGEDENDKLRKSALDKLEKASDDSFLGQASLFYPF